METEKESQQTFKRYPKNLFEYLSNISLNDNFFALFKENREKIKELIKSNRPPPEISNDLFIININNFKKDLIKLIDLFDKIKKQEDIVKDAIDSTKKTIYSIDTEELTKKATSFYFSARDYDDNFNHRHWSITKFRLNNWIFDNPFNHKSTDQPIEQLNKIKIAFSTYDSFFINFINTLYGDEEEGLNFINKSFADVICEYKWIKDEIQKIDINLKQREIERANKQIQTNQDLIMTIIKKHPATLYLAIVNLANFNKP